VIKELKLAANFFAIVGSVFYFLARFNFLLFAVI